MTDLRPIEAGALAYLAEQLGPRAPRQLTFEHEFSESPLEGEGRTVLFSFDLEPGSGAPECSAADRRHYVAFGETTPNFFPAYGLNPDEAYSFHVGTRFMLVMRVQKVEPEAAPPNARPSLDHMLASAAPGARVENVELAALFRCDDDYFAVYRLDIEGRRVYGLAADCPPGFHELTQHPPQMVLRLHLGQVIRAEARAAARAGESEARDETR